MTAINYVRPRLYPKQEAAIFTSARYSVIEASTKSGKSAGCMVWLLEKAMQGKEGQAYWWCAPTYAQALMIFRRMKRALPADIWKANETENTLTLANGAVIFFRSTDNPDNLYGEDCYAAVLDEASRIKEASWHAVRSTLTATRGPVRIIGNVRGRANWHYKLARVAQAGEDPNYHYAKLTAYDAVDGGVLELDEVEDAKRVLPRAVFDELYLAIPSESGANPFDLKAIEECVAPLGDGPATSFGWDLARGRAPGSDWTVGIGLNARRQVSTFDRFQGPWSMQLIRIRSATGHTPALVDATGVGDPIVEELQRGGGSYEAFKFTGESKQKIMEGLALAIQKRDIRFPPGLIVQELSDFTYTYTKTGVRYEAMEGLNDDAVCALALANAHFQDGGPRVRWL